MAVASPDESAVVGQLRPTAADLLSLTKPEISFLVAISVVAGFVSGSPEAVNWLTLLGTVAGTVLASGGAGALNHYLEREHDATMRRTASRPIPGGRVSPRFAKRFGLLLCAAGVGLLCPVSNWLTAALAIGTIATYLAAYTPLKRLTVHNTIVGTIPGALPALGGYTAATGTLGLAGWIVFAALVLWQLPHFYSLAWMYRKDYGRGGFAMLSVDDATGKRTAGAALAATLGLCVVTLLPYFLAPSLVYLIAITAVNAWLLASAVRFYRDRTHTSARSLLKTTVKYIPLYVVAVILHQSF